MPRIVAQVVIFKTKRADRRHLRDVFAGLRPMEMPGFSRQNDDASRLIGLHVFGVEDRTEPDIENTGHNRVGSIFRVLVRHQLCVGRQLHSDHLRTGIRRVANHDRQTSSGPKRRERLPVDVLGQDRLEIGLIRLMFQGHRRSPFRDDRKPEVTGSISYPV